MYIDNKWHTKWYGSTLGTLLVFVINITIYDWLYLSQYKGPYLLALKIIPLTCLIFQGLLYFSLYGFHYYASLVTSAFLFCLCGDILLAINNCSGLCSYFFVGGISFSIARLFMIVSLMVYPYSKYSNNISWEKISWGKSIILSIPSLTYGITAVVYFTISLSGKPIKIILLICSYICLMTCHTYAAAIRIWSLKIESNFPNIVNLIGVWLFCISDTLLLWNNFVFSSNVIVSIISLNFYWLAMSLISLSIIRNTTGFAAEKYGGRSLPLIINTIDINKKMISRYLHI